MKPNPRSAWAVAWGLTALLATAHATAQETIQNTLGLPGADITSVVRKKERWNRYAVRDVTATFRIVRAARPAGRVYFTITLWEDDPAADDNLGSITVCVDPGDWSVRPDGRVQVPESVTFKGISEYYGNDWYVEVIASTPCPPKLGRCGGGVEQQQNNYEYTYLVENDPDSVAMDPSAVLTMVAIGSHVVTLSPPLLRGQSTEFSFFDSAPPLPDDDPNTPNSTVPCVFYFSDGQSFFDATIGPGSPGPYSPELPTPAQDFLGLTHNGQVSATSRGSLNGSAGEVMTRLDGDEHAGWGTDAPGSRTIASIYLIIQDQDAVATPEEFEIVLYPEDPANPDYPDLSTQIPFMEGIPGPPAPASGVIAAAVRTVTPASPVAVPIQGGGDVFVSFVLPANAAWPNDGLSVQLVLGYQPSSQFTVWDTPGQLQGGTPPPPPAPWNSHGLTRFTGSSASYNTRRQHFIDIGHGTSGGLGLVITNQSTFVGSNNPPPPGFGPAPGTSDLLSGSNPDGAGFNPGRADDIGMRFVRTGMGSGSLVVFLASFDPTFGPEIPLVSIVPGSTGVVCLAPGFQTLGLRFPTADEAFVTISIPAGLRGTLAGLTVRQQAIALVATGVLHAGPCDSIRF